MVEVGVEWQMGMHRHAFKQRANVGTWSADVRDKKTGLRRFFCIGECWKLAYLARDSGSSSRILPSISFSTRGLATTMLPEFS